MSLEFRYDARQERYIRRPPYELRQLSQEQFMEWLLDGMPVERTRERSSARIYSSDQDDESLLEGEKAGRWRITDDLRWEKIA